LLRCGPGDGAGMQGLCCSSRVQRLKVSCSSAEDHTCCGAFDPFRGTKDWRAHFRLH
ncbi:hypothetical protein ACJX0J_038589, partial [Zea mays]